MTKRFLERSLAFTFVVSLCSAGALDARAQSLTRQEKPAQTGDGLFLQKPTGDTPVKQIDLVKQVNQSNYDKVLHTPGIEEVYAIQKTGGLGGVTYNSVTVFKSGPDGTPVAVKSTGSYEVSVKGKGKIPESVLKKTVGLPTKADGTLQKNGKLPFLVIVDKAGATKFIGSDDKTTSMKIEFKSKSYKLVITSFEMNGKDTVAVDQITITFSKDGSATDLQLKRLNEK